MELGRIDDDVGGRPEPESANQSAKTKWRRRPAAAAPPRRLEQVALRQSSLESARASRARVRAAIQVNADVVDDLLTEED